MHKILRFCLPVKREVLNIERTSVNDLSLIPAHRSKGGYDFVDDYLRTDGVLVLKLIRLNMGVHVSRELVIALFPLFIESAKRTSEAKGVSIDVGYEFDSPTTTTTTSNERFLPLTNDGDGHQKTSPV